MKYDCVEEWMSNKVHVKNELYLKIIQLNIRGMNDSTKFDNVREILHRYDKRVDIIALSETWVKADRQCLFKLDGFTSIFSCRNESHGGLAVFIRDDMALDILRNRTFCGFHHIHLQLQSHGNKIDFHAVYRPPSFDARMCLNEIEDMMSNVNKDNRCILVGDLNIPTNIQSNNIVREYERLLSSFNMVVTNTNVTRPTSGNILDHVVCSDTLSDTVVNETVFNDLSDHCLILSSFDLTCSRSRTVLQKQIVDHRRLNELLLASMSGLSQQNTANEKLAHVINSYNSLRTQCTRTVTIQAKLKRHCPWMTIDVWQLIRMKDNLLKSKRRNPADVRIRELLEHVSQKLLKKKVQCKRDYYKRMLSGNSRKHSWKLINDVIGKQRSGNQPTVITSDGHTITDANQVCNAFNEHFCNVGKKIGCYYR